MYLTLTLLRHSGTPLLDGDTTGSSTKMAELWATVDRARRRTLQWILGGASFIIAHTVCVSATRLARTQIATSVCCLLQRMLTKTGASKDISSPGSCHQRQKPQAPIRNRQTREVANAKVRNRCANLTYIMIGLPIIWRLRRWRLWFLALSNASL